MDFVDSIIARAQAAPGNLVLPEPEDERVLRAADIIEARSIARVTLVGDPDRVVASARALGIARRFRIIDPSKSEWLDEFASEYFALRRSKGVSAEAARQTMLNPIAHGVMMLHKGKADGLVAGAIHATGDTLRPALQILRTAPGVSLVSSFFFMTFGDTAYLFADCGLVEDPSAQELAEIALCTAQTAMSFGIDPAVAMLSYSTKGSADSPLTRKVVEATRLALEGALHRFGPDSPVRIDGELQGDAALVEGVARRKAPDSPVAGKARVLVFPDLNAGNIAYKLVERMAGARAYGPILQGLRLPVNDLSRGCSADDIVGVAAVTVVQGQMLAKELAGQAGPPPSSKAVQE